MADDTGYGSLISDPYGFLNSMMVPNASKKRKATNVFDEGYQSPGAPLPTPPRSPNMAMGGGAPSIGQGFGAADILKQFIGGGSAPGTPSAALGPGGIGGTASTLGPTGVALPQSVGEMGMSTMDMLTKLASLFI
jgi:hypothetical protein